MRKLPTITEYKEGILSGNIAMLSRAITLIESRNLQHQALAIQLIEEILPYTGNAKRIGITGVPGVGKSTFIESFGMHLIEEGHKVAVLAIDPSSNISKGSILGDKTRMERLSVHPDAYIRPSASSGSLGGVTYKTREATLLCEAAGFDTIIIETVGVGQSETEVSEITDFFLLLMLAGAGDELQGIKRGIMEMADALVITKADGDNLQKAKLARAEYARALHFLPPSLSGWTPVVEISSAFDKEKVANVGEIIEKYYRHSISNGYWDKRRQDQNIIAFDKLMNEQLLRLLTQKFGLDTQVQQIKSAVKDGQMTPYKAVLDLTAIFNDK